MSSGPSDGFGIVMNRHHFPNRDPMPKDKRFASADRIAKANAREFLLQGFFLEVQTAQSGHLEMTPFRLAREQGGMTRFDPTRLHNCGHDQIVVYNVNGVKPE